MAAIVLPNGRNYFTNSLGAPLIGGRVYTYIPGTSTPKATYTTSAGTTPNANPVVLDVRGEAAIYWTGDYDVVLKDASDVTIWGPERLNEPETAGSAAAVLADLADTASAANGDALIGVRRTATGAVATTGHAWLEAQIVNVKADFGAVGDGVNDDTAEIQAAIDSFASGNGTVYFPPGVYKTTSTILVSQQRVHLVGAGAWSTRILFAPTANDICLELKLGTANVLYQGSVRGICFYSDDSTYTKTAIEAVDTAGYELHDIIVGGSVVVGSSSYWGGANSIGIRTRGREALTASHWFIAANRPIVMSVNPNNSIGVDHFHFQDTYLLASGNPCVEIEDGVQVTNLTFDGYQPWVLGTSGLKWTNTLSAGLANSQNVTLRNIRTEQGTSATAFSIDIHFTALALQRLTIEDCQFDTAREGVKLRGLRHAAMRDTINAMGAGRVALDIDSTVHGFSWDNVIWGASGTATVAGQKFIYMTERPDSSNPLGPSGAYQLDTLANRETQTELANGGYRITLADDATHVLGPQTSQLVVTVLASEDTAGIYLLRGTSNATVEMVDPQAVFANADSDTFHCIYYDGANYVLKNRRGVSQNYIISLVGTFANL